MGWLRLRVRQRSCQQAASSDGGAGAFGVEFDGAFDGTFGLVPGGGLGDADEVFEGRVPI